MPEAESVHSTQPTNTPVSQNNPVDATSRRRFLTNAAGVAAGGAVLAMATVPAAADAAAPVAAVASSGVDPVFALIEGYRTAAKTVALAAGEVSRREGVLIEQGLGLVPFISVLEMRDGFCAKQPVMVYKRECVDDHIPPDLFGKLNADAHAALDAQFDRHKAIMGDSERVLYGAQDVETEDYDRVGLIIIQKSARAAQFRQQFQ